MYLTDKKEKLDDKAKQARPGEMFPGPLSRKGRSIRLHPSGSYHEHRFGLVVAPSLRGR
jgi:hypothetical protein